MGQIVNSFNEFTHNLNKGYNYDAIPQRDVVHPPHHPNVDMKEISIDDANPVAKFKDWSRQYWLQKPAILKLRKKNKKSNIPY